MLLKERLRVWAPFIGLLFAIYHAYDYYMVFKTDAASPLMTKNSELSLAIKQNKDLEGKVKSLEEFAKRQKADQENLLALVQQLAETKDALADDVQMPDFMKLVVSEAKRVGMNVLSIVPARKEKKEYYYEYPVEVKFRGLFAQVYSFVNRIASMQRIVRVEKFDMRPVANSFGKYVELEGSLELKTFSYLGSQADDVGKKKGSK